MISEQGLAKLIILVGAVLGTLALATIAYMYNLDKDIADEIDKVWYAIITLCILIASILLVAAGFMIKPI